MKRGELLGITAGFFVAILGFAKGDSPSQIFEQRILPILKSDKASSCTECHLTGVELRNYLMPSAELTFANLRDLKLVDLDQPEKSEILRFIKMSPESKGDSAPGKARVQPEVRKSELEAFSEWILAAAKDPRFRNAPSPETLTPETAPEVVRHGRMDRLLQSYEENIWALRFRCAGCHMPGEGKFQKHADEHGFEKMAWLRARGPATSMEVLMAGDLLDLEHPENSELLLKPLDESGEEHGGGVKMRRGDTDYLAFLQWIQDYANIVNGNYTEAKDLPGDVWHGTEIWLRITGLPVELKDKQVVMTLQASPDAKPIALASTTVVHQPKREIVMANGFLVQRSKEELGPASYIVRLWKAGELDMESREVWDWDNALKQATPLYEGKVESGWKPGFKQSTIVSLDGFRPSGEH